MNTLPATITEITSSVRTSLVSVHFQHDLFHLLLAELPNESLGDPITLAFKETEIILMASDTLSTANLHHARITTIRRGEVLTHVTLAYHNSVIHALVPTLTFNALERREGDTVAWMIQPSEISLLRGHHES